MPRHRKECIPKHRALRPNHQSGRRVPVSAAIEENGQAPPAASPTMPLPRPSARSRPSGSRRPPAGGESRTEPRRMRGLLVTPWFAAGAGFVIAAALALNSPHTVLTYRPHTSKCSTCTSPGSLATAKPGLHVKAAKPVKPARAGQGAVAAGPGQAAGAGPEIGFQVVWQRDGAFAAIINVPVAQPRHGWDLRFEIPGRRIIQVQGANWQSAPGGHGGLASMLTYQPGQSGPPRDSRPPDPPGAGQRSTGQPGMPDDQGPWVPQALRFLVTAQGSPVTPVACLLNGADCHFG